MKYISLFIAVFLCTSCAEWRPLEDTRTIGTVTEVRMVGGSRVVKTGDNPAGAALLGGLAAGTTGAVIGASAAKPQSVQTFNDVGACTLVMDVDSTDNTGQQRRTFSWFSGDESRGVVPREETRMTRKCALLVPGDKVMVVRQRFSGGGELWTVWLEGE